MTTPMYWTVPRSGAGRQVRATAGRRYGRRVVTAGETQAGRSSDHRPVGALVRAHAPEGRGEGSQAASGSHGCLRRVRVRVGADGTDAVLDARFA